MGFSPRSLAHRPPSPIIFDLWLSGFRSMFLKVAHVKKGGMSHDCGPRHVADARGEVVNLAVTFGTGVPPVHTAEPQGEFHGIISHFVAVAELARADNVHVSVSNVRQGSCS